MKISDKAFKVFVYSGFGVACPILVVTLGMLLAGYHISTEAKFWLWLVALVSLIIMVMALIRILCDFLPVDRLANKIRNHHYTSEVQAALDKIEIEDQKISTSEKIQEENPLKSYFVWQFVNKDYVNQPVFETYQKLFKEKNGGKNVVLAFYCGADTNMNWLISIPTHAEAVRIFGEETVGSKNNYSVQKGNFTPGNLDDKKLSEIRAMKLLMKKILADLQEQA